MTNKTIRKNKVTNNPNINSFKVLYKTMIVTHKADNSKTNNKKIYKNKTMTNLITAVWKGI